LRECLRGRRFRASLLLHTTCVRSWCNWHTRCVTTKHVIKKKPSVNIPITLRLCIPSDKGFAKCLHTCNPMLKGLYFNAHTCLMLPMNTHIRCSLKKCSLLYAPPLPICAFFNIIFIRIYSIRIYSIHLNMCSCLHQDCSIQIKRMHVNKWMRNKIHIHAYMHIHIKCKLQD